MNKEIVDGVTVYSNLYTEDDFTWHILIREGGSVSLYATHPNSGGCLVAYDSLDDVPIGETAKGVIKKLSEMKEGINALLAHTKGL